MCFVFTCYVGLYFLVLIFHIECNVTIQSSSLVFPIIILTIIAKLTTLLIEELRYRFYQHC